MHTVQALSYDNSDTWYKITLTSSQIIWKPYLALSFNTYVMCLIFFMSDLKLHSLKNMTPSHLTRPGILQLSPLVFSPCMHHSHNALKSNKTKNPTSIFTICVHNALTSNQTRDREHMLPAMLDYKGLLSEYSPPLKGNYVE